MDVILPVLADPAIPDQQAGVLLRERIGMAQLRAAGAGGWKPLARDHGRLSALEEQRNEEWRYGTKNEWHEGGCRRALGRVHARFIAFPQFMGVTWLACHSRRYLALPVGKPGGLPVRDSAGHRP